MIKVSVIIPVYNGEMYLKECLDSVLYQTLDEIEIICIDDASTDTTPAILQEYSRNFGKIKVITNTKNCGAGVSRNRGLAFAKGVYVIFLDADDIFDNNMLEQTVRRIEKYQADICIFREDKFIGNLSECITYDYPRKYWKRLEEAGAFSSEDVKDILFNLWNGWPWDKLFRKEFILKNELHFQEIRSSEDGLFVHGALFVAERITCLDKIYVHHRENLKTSLSNQRDDSWECCCLYLKALKAYLIECSNFPKYEISFVNWAVDFLYWNYWSLNEKNRQNLFHLLKKNVLNELELLKYNKEIFYNDFHYWCIHSIDGCHTYKDCLVPVEGIQRWEAMLFHNKMKIEKIFQFFRTHQYKAALWCAGARGEIFLEEYDKKEEIIKVFDEDIGRSGEKFAGKYTVESFNSATCKNIDFIIVTNRRFFESIVKTVKEVKIDIHVFNLDLYLVSFRAFPVSLEECIL